MTDHQKLTYKVHEVKATSDQLANYVVTLLATGKPAALECPCPSCFGTCSVRLSQQMIASAVAPERSNGEAGEVETGQRTIAITCNCLEEHPHQLPDANGCGATWEVTIRPKGGGGWEPELPDERFVNDARKVSQLQRATLTLGEVRGLAEKWLAAITALLGLFSISAALIGRESLKGLGQTPKALAAALAAVGVLLGIAATLFGYEAAYGWARVESIPPDGPALTAWIANQQHRHRNRPIAAATALRRGVASAAAASGVFLVALGIVWFGGRPPESSGKVSLTYTDSAGATHSRCGSLIQLDKTTVEIAVSVGGRSDSEQHEVSKIETIEAVKDC